MTVECFFELFLQELADNRDLWRYYKFLESPARLHFRQAYFCQRLRYIQQHLPPGGAATRIFDCGCGYATTALFLAMNGIPVRGNTLEFYYEQIPRRLAYWRQFGDVSLLDISYENLFDMKIPADSLDAIIIQDTLHHLEPIAEALGLLHKALRPGGALIAIEENGRNIIQNTKLFLQRGNRRVITIHDEKLQKDILLGNENIRSVAAWRALFVQAGFQFNDESVEYIRYLLPWQTHRFANIAELIAREQALQSRWRREYFFFGINFTATK